ncbi:MAG: NfeD family protein [Prevotella sp.]
MIDYLTTNFWLLWTLVCVVALILEVSSGTFYLMCFAIGAVGAVVVSLMGTPLWLQVLVFSAISAVSVFCVRPLLVKCLHPVQKERLSNASALVGRQGVVIEPISAERPGYVRVDGDEWRAVTADGTMIERGVNVRITAMNSIVVTVEPVA